MSDTISILKKVLGNEERIYGNYKKIEQNIAPGDKITGEFLKHILENNQKHRKIIENIINSLHTGGNCKGERAKPRRD